MGHRLPPLNTLRLFEAAARHLSFKLAAEDLGITRSAVSHGIQTLEDWLGVPLFARGNRGLSLTDAGRAYLQPVRQALTLIASATERVPTRAPRSHLSLSVAPAFAERILLPMLPRFHASNPEVTVSLDTSQRQIEFPRDGMDLAIRTGRGSWAGLEAVQAMGERLVPVCSPRLLQGLSPLRSLCDAPLIHSTVCSQDWDAWAKAAGIGPVDCRRGLMLDSLQMVYEAAVQGLGVAIGRRPLVDKELTSGRLVVFCGPTVPSETSYWLVGLPESMRRPEIAAFARWLLSELEALSRASAENDAVLHPSRPVLVHARHAS